MVAGVTRELSEISLPTVPSLSPNATQSDFALQLPSYVRGLNLKNAYSPELGVYNMKVENTQKLRAGIGRAYAGVGAANLLAVGDSETDAYDGVFDQLGAWPVVLRNELGVAIGGDGWVKAGNMGTAADPRWTTTGTWTRTGQLWAQSPAAAGATITLRLTQPCTSIMLEWYLGSGAFTVSVRGATTGSQFASLIGNVTVAWTSTTFTGVYPAGTQVTITTTTTSAIVIQGALCTSTVGAHMHNFSQYGWRSMDWVSTPAWNQSETMMEGVISSATVDCVFYMIGTNDKNATANGGTQRTDAAIVADITTLRNRWSSSDFIFLTPPHPTGYATQAQWESYLGACYQMADTLNIPLFDLYDVIGNYTTANSHGLMADTVHLNKAGQRECGTQMAECIGNSLATALLSAKTPASRALSRMVWR